LFSVGSSFFFYTILVIGFIGHRCS